jgi:hypothetical protein
MTKISSIVEILAKLSLLAALILLLSNLRYTMTPAHAWLSSLPLALGGIAFGVLQVILKPTRGILFRRLLLAAAFVAWAVDQLLPVGYLATAVGDAVISAYVLDLYWMMRGEQEVRKTESID